MCTTKSTIPTHEYSPVNQPVKIDYKQFANTCIATVAAISSEGGVDLAMNFNKSVDKFKFVEFLQELKKKTKR